MYPQPVTAPNSNAPRRAEGLFRYASEPLGPAIPTLLLTPKWLPFTPPHWSTFNPPLTRVKGSGLTGLEQDDADEEEAYDDEDGDQDVEQVVHGDGCCSL